MANLQNQVIRIFAAFGLALFGVTWKLWTPQTMFPQIPFFEFLIDVPGWVDWIAFGAILTGLIILLVKGRSWKNSSGNQLLVVGCLLFCVGLIVSILLNQHRLQPWAYQLLIFITLFGLAEFENLPGLNWDNRNPNRVVVTKEEMVKGMRLIVISIYVFSAISKFDYQFVHTTGLQILDTLFGFAGQETPNLSAKLKAGLVLLFPVGELLVAFVLAFTRSRTILNLAIIAAVGIHVALILILGPLGLGHKPAVLIWNLLFAFQVVWLFWGSECGPDPEDFDSADETDTSLSWTGGVAVSVCLFVLLFPTTQWFGICDHWPAWQVYSPSSSRAKLINERSLSEWSLEELGVPVYPQSRFQLGVIQAVLEEREIRNGFHLELSSQSNRLTGERETEVFANLDRLKIAVRKFRLNTKSRKIW